MELPNHGNLNASKAVYSFSAYKNYLQSLSYLIKIQYPSHQKIKESISPIQRNTSVDVSKVRSLLFNSWNSEVLLNFPKFLEPDFIKFSNHWSPVQSYYAIYLSLRSLIVAKNIQANGDHTTTLQVCMANLIEGQKLFPTPWNLLASNSGCTNLPTDYTPVSVNAQENPIFFSENKDKLLASACMFVRTTRERIVDERCEEWKEKNPTKTGKRLKLPAGKRTEIDNRIRNVSVFDGLYRLRIRSNYKDVDIFILGSDLNDAQSYLRSLCNITDKTLFMLESYVLQSIGKKEFETICTEYINSISLEPITNKKMGISRRVETHLA